MKFAHLVQINDPFNPLIEPLTPAQVWRGLALRAEEPRRFNETLDECTLLERGPDFIRRELRFGHLIVRDRVRFEAQRRLVQDIEPGLETPRATLTTTIETPGEEQLFVRFEYETGVVDGAPPTDEFYEGFVKEAYIAADVDAIRTIRRLAAEGSV